MSSFDSTNPKSTSNRSTTQGAGDPLGKGSYASPRSADLPTSDDVRDIAGNVADDLKETAGRVAGQAQQAAGEIGGHLTDAAARLAQTQMKAGADLVQNVSKAADAAARQLSADAPEIGRYVGDIARTLERVAGDLRDRSLGESFNAFSDFARRQPMTVMAGAVFGGFLVSRFLKSTSERSFESPYLARRGRPVDAAPLRQGVDGRGLTSPPRDPAFRPVLPGLAVRRRRPARHRGRARLRVLPGLSGGPSGERHGR